MAAMANNIKIIIKTDRFILDYLSQIALDFHSNPNFLIAFINLIPYLLQFSISINSKEKNKQKFLRGKGIKPYKE